MKSKILTVVGTRPEAIKMAPLIKSLQQDESFQVQVCSTGQHREMLDQVLTIFGIEVDVELGLMTADQSLSSLAGNCIQAVDKVLGSVKPNCVLVHGDTATSMAASMASFFNGIIVGHVEAGLRTGDLSSPFPEEFNRRINSLVSSMHFAPTYQCRENLINEGVSSSNIFVTGNTVIDAIKMMKSSFNENQKLREHVDGFIKEYLGPEDSFDRMVLVTSHRRENLGVGLVNICNAIRTLAERHPRTVFFFPVHLNPKVRDVVHEKLGGIKNITLSGPVDYAVFCRLMDLSYLVLTDSGGLQEEAPALGKPVLLMRENTERPEAVDAGTVKLVGTNPDIIVSSVENLFASDKEYFDMASSANPYGDGTASSKIVDQIKARVRS